MTGSETFQQIFAVMIAGNFLTYIIQAQLQPDPGSQPALVLYRIYVFFTAVGAPISLRLLLLSTLK